MGRRGFLGFLQCLDWWLLVMKGPFFFFFCSGGCGSGSSGGGLMEERGDEAQLKSEVSTRGGCDGSDTVFGDTYGSLW
jgi:hypothetical protein